MSLLLLLLLLLLPKYGKLRSCAGSRVPCDVGQSVVWRVWIHSQTLSLVHVCGPRSVEVPREGRGQGFSGCGEL